MSAQPRPGKKPSCFMVMPFGGIFDTYYERIYRPAIANADLLPVRADDAFSAGSILYDIVAMLVDSSIVLADITESNRNVHYELGLAHALGKPTVLVAPKGLKLFFDVGQERMLIYDKDVPSWGADLQAQITRSIQETLRNPETAIPTAFMHIRPARIETDEVTVRLRRIEERLAELAAGGLRAGVELRSSLQHKMTGLPATEVEAEQLLQRMGPADAIERLVNNGIGRAMAESAVATASKRLGISGH
ncbi:MAG: hypothetical protein ACOZDY_01010 [Pseudomonadota bacterium]